MDFKDVLSIWVNIKDPKQSILVELAKYAVANRLLDDPALKLWVKDVLNNRDCIVSKVKSNYWCTSHTFGVRITKSVQ